MKSFKVNYNKTPTRQNTEKCIVVKADDEIEALITAFDHFTQKGHLVALTGTKIKLTNEQRDTLNKRGVKFEPFQSNGMLVFLEVNEYTVKPQGKVVEG